MPSHRHATMTEMFLARPRLAAEVLTEILDEPLPPYRSARAAPADATMLRSTEHHADAVILLDDDVGSPAAAVVVEVQLRPDEDERWTWPVYLASVRLRWRCPAVLLVLCPDAATARWARSPIDVGQSGFRLRPAVLGPGTLPPVTDLAVAARNPELTVLSVLASTDDESSTRLDVLADALASVRPDLAVEYALLVLAALPARAAAHLEELMSTRSHTYQSEFTRRLRDEGRIAERVAVILRILANRGVQVDDRARARISSCSDLTVLERWTDRALVVATTDELFSA